jgi:hypothetical protein
MIKVLDYVEGTYGRYGEANPPLQDYLNSLNGTIISVMLLGIDIRSGYGEVASYRIVYSENESQS